MYLADLHIHSHYAYATSKDADLEHLDLWARRKGIHLVGTGDFTHPAWRDEMREKLVPAEEGFYILKEEYRIQDDSVADTMIPRFVVTGEISTIYKKYEKTRKVHSVIILSGIEEADRLAAALEPIGNLHSDGRPTLKLDCRDLLEITLENASDVMYIPAHIWTPHFLIFGAFSRFHSIEECFCDLSGYIHALETGLSSDPPMNWRISSLDRYQLVSNSDAHSPGKLGREATVLDGDFSFSGLKKAFETGNGLYGTLEFFPEEGKYHSDGHRKCHVCLTPKETKELGGICPVCGKKLTIGVSNRIAEMADREHGFIKEGAKPFETLVPLPEIIGAALNHSSTCGKVQKEYSKMLKTFGPEFEILRNVPVEEIRSVSGEVIADGVHRLREKKVTCTPGFDGEFGKIQFF